MTHTIIDPLSARISSNALREVAARLRSKGKDDYANRIADVAKALDENETIHISSNAGRA